MSLLLGAIVSSTDAAAVFSVLTRQRHATATTRRPHARGGVGAQRSDGRHPHHGAHRRHWSAGSDARCVDRVGRRASSWPSAPSMGYVDRARWTLAHPAHSAPRRGLYPAFTLALACLVVRRDHVAARQRLSRRVRHRHDARQRCAAARRRHPPRARRARLAQPGGDVPAARPARVSVALVARGADGTRRSRCFSRSSRGRVGGDALPRARSAIAWRESAYVGWVGLRGAVPIVLATIPVMADVPGARELFDVVFFIVVVGALVPGATVPWVARLLEVESTAPPPPATRDRGRRARAAGRRAARVFRVGASSRSAGRRSPRVPFPAGSGGEHARAGRLAHRAVGGDAPRAGDYVYVIAPSDDRRSSSCCSASRKSTDEVRTAALGPIARPLKLNVTDLSKRGSGAARQGLPRLW